jgi:hypothetical protein
MSGFDGDDDPHDKLTDAGTALAEYRPRLMVSPEDARGLVDGVAEISRSILTEGTDYGTIPGTPKPSLYKPGAEKLLGFFGFGHHFEELSVERQADGRFLGVTYRCLVTKGVGEREIVVASCDGYCGHDESKWERAPRNTVVKMAQKRALVGACLQATATSGLFTQDVEDLPADQRASSYTPKAGGGGASGKQLNFLATLLREKVGSEASMIRKFVADKIGREIQKKEELTKREASQLIEILKETKDIHHEGPPMDEDPADVCPFCMESPCACPDDMGGAPY